MKRTTRKTDKPTKTVKSKARKVSSGAKRGGTFQAAGKVTVSGKRATSKTTKRSDRKTNSTGPRKA